VQANKGKSAVTAGRLDERQRDWVPLREITKPSGPQPLYRSTQDDLAANRDEIEKGIRD